MTSIRTDRRRAGVLAASALLILALRGRAAAEEPNGRQIIDRVADRHERAFEYEEQRWILIDDGASWEERTVRRYFREEDSSFRFLLVLDAPRNVRGVALLAWERPGAANDQWQYLPSAGRKLTRIAEGGRRNPFLGTDFAFEDLLPEERDRFRYERYPDELLEGVAHYVVAALPEAEHIRRSTGYAKRLMFVRQDLEFIARIDYFDRRDQLIKRQMFESLVTIDGTGYRADQVSMTDLRTGHATQVHTLARRVDATAVPQDVFEHGFITSGRHLRR